MAIFSYKVLGLLLFFSCLYYLSYAKSIDFQIPRFDSNADNILFQGDAERSNGSIEFNLVNFMSRVGWAYYADRVRLWDSSSGKLSDFSTRFGITIDTQGGNKYGHGFTFFLAPVGSQIPANSAGGFLGLFTNNNRNSSSNQIVMVEFDSFNNPDWDPIDVQGHVGININSIASSVYTSWNASFHSGDPADVRINYNATTKNLSVAWTYQTTINASEKSSLSYAIDLRTVLPEWVMIGFSAATGLSVERHTLESWEFRSSLDVNESNENTAEKSRIIGGVTGSLGGLIIVGVIIALVFSWRRKQTKREAEDTTNFTSINNDDLEREAGPRRFFYEELVSATKNFSDDRRLGKGGFGIVYRGFLVDVNIEVAVKRISRGSKQGKKEYMTEVKIISQLRHRNLVQLIGWCHERGELLLVYEFMSNGSLDSHLFGKRTPLNWGVRYEIALGLAAGLLYLHKEWKQCVVHRDIKSSNLMLDSNFVAKLGDFGLARLMDHGIGQRTTGLAGTFGYLAPECISASRLSKESDVYSFGVVALEIATGRNAATYMEKRPVYGLVGWVWDLYGSGKLHLAVDEKLNMDFDKNQVECLLIVGLWCAHPDFKQRPSIRQAIQVLNFEVEMPDLPTKMPVPMFHVPTPSLSSEGAPSASELSKATITNSSLVVGR